MLKAKRERVHLQPFVTSGKLHVHFLQVDLGNMHTFDI